MADDTPHDKLFFKMFSLPDNAGGALRAVLPRQIVQAADWSTLKLRGSRFVDSELKGSQSDLLFEVAVGESKVLLYLLFEHQSTDDALMPYRLLRYMIRIWEQWIAEQQEHPKLLPAIVPVVMSHSEGGWRRAVSMHELFDPLAVQAAGEHLPGFRFVLDDLTMRSNGELMARAASDLATLATLFLKNVRDAPDLGALFMQWSPLLQRVFAAADGHEAVTALFYYVMLARASVMHQELIEMVRASVGPSAGELVMTLGEQLIAQGRVEGRVEGLVKGQVAAVLCVLKARAISVPPAVQAKIQGCDDTKILEQWLVRAATCSSAEELFA